MPTGMIRMLSGCFCAEIRSSGRIISQESIRSRSERRRGYHRYYTGEEWGYAENYDLCIDAVRLGVDKTAELIADYVKHVGGR